MKYLILLIVSFYLLPINCQIQIGNDITGDLPSDLAGRSVALSADGKRVAVGAPYNNGTGTDQGQVRIFEENGGTWKQLGSDILGEGNSDRSGWSVALSANGKRVAVGALLNDGGSFNTGHVRIYEETGGVWKQLGSDIDGENSGDRSGFSVALSDDGRRVAIGAIYNSSNGYNAGQVRVFEENNAIWTRVGTDIDGEADSDESGRSVSLSADGKRVAIGAIFNDGSGLSSGNVRVFDEINGSWVKVGTDIDGEAASDESGWSVSLSSSGKRIAIGARYNDGNGSDAGHVRIFEESGGSWAQVGTDIDGSTVASAAGVVSLSGNGKRVAIGAPFNSENGNNAGKLSIYDEIGGVWTQIGSDVLGVATEDRFGWAVALSSDGKRVAAGAIYNSDNGNNSGHVRIYGGSLIPTEDLNVKEVFSIQLTPNPTKDKFTLNLDLNQVTDLQIKIMAYTGKILLEESLKEVIGEFSKKYDLTLFPEGIYFIEVSNNEKSITKKLLLHH